MSVPGVRPFSPRARALPMLLSETEILAVGTRSTAGTVLVTASTLACRREVLPTKARFDGPGGYGEHVQVLNQAEVRNSRLRMSAGRPTQGQPARYFREERF